MSIIDQTTLIERAAPQSGIVGGPSAILNPDIAITMAPEWFKQLTLTWTYPTSMNTGGAPIFDVYRSGAEDSDYVKLNTFPLTTPQFLDTTTRQDSNSSFDYYIVAVTTFGGQVFHSEPFFLVYDRKMKDRARILAKELDRRNWLLLRKFTGVETLLFKEKTYGERCTECWSEKYQKIMKPQCVTCAGTSYMKGYYDPVKTYFQYEPHHKSKDLFHFGRVDPNLSGAWTVSYPNINVGDILLRQHDFRMFRVERTDVTSLQTVEVRQMVALIELAHDHPAHVIFKREGLIP